MHGISAIIAIVLIIMIVVALAGLSYMFFTGIITSTTETTEESITRTTTGLLANAKIESISINDVYVRNVGQSDLTVFAVYLNDALAHFSSPDVVKPGETGSITIYDFIKEGDDIKVTTAEGMMINKKAPDPCDEAVLCLGMDEGSGDTVGDSAGHSGNDGKFEGETFNDGIINGATRVDGKFGKGLKFDGIDDYVEVAHKPSLNVKSITSMYWIKLNQLGTYQYALSKHEVFRMRVQPSDFRLQVFIDGTWRQLICGTPNQDLWEHHCLVYNETTHMLQFYVNGNLVNETELTGLSNYELETSTNPVLISQEAETVSGIIDEVRIYNRSLTEEEIQTEMQSSKPLIRTVASYSFEESGQNVNDDHIWVKGKRGSALSFDGNDDYVEVLDDISLNFGTIDFTTELWIKTPTIGATHRPVIDKTNGASQVWYGPLILSNTGKVRALIDDGPDAYYVTSTNRVDDNEWNHIVCVFDRDTKIRIFINGVEETVTESGTITDVGSIDNSVNLSIAHRTAYFNGIIDEVRIYNKAIY